MFAFYLASFFKEIKRSIETFGFHVIYTSLSSVVEIMWRLPKCNIKPTWIQLFFSVKGLLCNLGSLSQELRLFQFGWPKMGCVWAKTCFTGPCDWCLTISYLQPCVFYNLLWAHVLCMHFILFTLQTGDMTVVNPLFSDQEVVGSDQDGNGDKSGASGQGSPVAPRHSFKES